MRAQVLRRAARGETHEQIAQYVPLHPDTIKRLLTRFRKYGLAVLEDRPHPGRAPVLTPQMRTTLLHCLRQADRAWTCAQLAELLHQQYGVQVHIETIRQFLRRAGFVWRRTRYVPAKRPNPQEYADACEDLAHLKRGLSRTCMNYGMWTRRGAV
ncbi:MAG: helix-turn-helix domain-containing protein [bacterium]|nr:helix-turn-helix domain-containing protein [bacterium]